MMQECPFCMTQLDERATVCTGCGAKKGFGYHSSYGVLTEKKVRSRLRKFSIAKNLASIIAFIAIVSIYFSSDSDISAILSIAAIWLIFFLIPWLGHRVWSKRLQKNDQSWWR